MIDTLKKDLGSQFAMKDLGPAQQILGMRIMCNKKKKKCGCHKKNVLKRCLINSI